MSSFSVYYASLPQRKADDLTITKGVDTVSNFVAKPSQEEKAVQKSTARYKFVLHFVLHFSLNLCYTFICYPTFPLKAGKTTKNFKCNEKKFS